MDPHYVGSRKDSKGRKSIRTSRRPSVWTLQICPTTGGTMPIMISAAETVDGLKKAVSKLIRIQKDRITLLYKDSVLTEGSTLQDAGLKDGCKVTLLPNVETGLVSQKPDHSVMQALENLSENQVNDFLTGKCPLTLAMRLGEHMMLVQLQLSSPEAAASAGASAGGASGSGCASSAGGGACRRGRCGSARRHHPYPSVSLTCTQPNPAAPRFQTTPAPSSTRTSGVQSSSTSSSSSIPHPLVPRASHRTSSSATSSSSQPTTSSSSSSHLRDGRHYIHREPVPQQQQQRAERAYHSCSPVPTLVPPPQRASDKIVPLLPTPVFASINPGMPIPKLVPTSTTTSAGPPIPLASSFRTLSSSSSSSSSSLSFSKSQETSKTASPQASSSGQFADAEEEHGKTAFRNEKIRKSEKVPSSSDTASPELVKDLVSSESVAKKDNGKPTAGQVKQQLHHHFHHHQQQQQQQQQHPGHHHYHHYQQQQQQQHRHRHRHQASSSSTSASASASGSSASSTGANGAIIDSMHHLGQGVYSGTFSGTINPTLQDTSGKPKRSLTTIIHILNDLLGATPHPGRVLPPALAAAAAAAAGRHPGALQTATAPSTVSSASASSSSSSTHAAVNGSRSSAVTPQKLRDDRQRAQKGEENRALKGKVAQLQAMLQEKRAHRRARRQARAVPYSCWAAKSSGLAGSSPLSRHSSVSSCASEDATVGMDEDSSNADVNATENEDDDVTGTFTAELPAESEADITPPGAVLA